MLTALRTCSKYGINFLQIRKHTTRIVTTGLLDEDVDKLLSEGLHPKQHSGKRETKCVTIPALLEKACYKIIKRHNNKSFRDDIVQMSGRVIASQMPMELEEKLMRAKEIEEEEISKEKGNIDWLTEEEQEVALSKRYDKILARVKNETYNWKEIDFNLYQSVVYMAARLPANYASLLHVFNEIKKDYPTFVPQTLFDFGSGVGTVMWAANQVWPKSINEHFNVDISQHMNETSRLLLQQGDEDNELYFNGVFYREFLPVSSDIKYNLVVSAFSLVDLPSKSSRIHVIENLWHKTEDLLVIVEHGNASGFAAILEARNLVLQISGHKVTQTFRVDSRYRNVAQMNHNLSPTCHIIAPCSHNLPCPKLFTSGVPLCNFKVKYNQLDVGFKTPVNQEKFSYIVLQKGPPPDKDKPEWPRVIQPIIKKHGCCITRMCCPDGTLKEIVFTKSKHPKNLYNCVKSSEWSDLLPITIDYYEKKLFKEMVKEKQLLKAGQIESGGELKNVS